MPRLTSKGQVTIPKAMRERLGLIRGSEVVFVESGDAIIMRPARPRAGRGARLVASVVGRRRG